MEHQLLIDEPQVVLARSNVVGILSHGHDQVMNRVLLMILSLFGPSNQFAQKVQDNLSMHDIARQFRLLQVPYSHKVLVDLLLIIILIAVGFEDTLPLFQKLRFQTRLFFVQSQLHVLGSTRGRQAELFLSL